MKLETKFNLKDEVYFLKNNKVKCGIISAIAVFECGTAQSKINYNAEDKNNPITWLDFTDLHEEDLYKTKEELLKKL